MLEHYNKLLSLNTVNHETYYKILKAKGCAIFDEHGNIQRIDGDQKKILSEALSEYE